MRTPRPFLLLSFSLVTAGAIPDALAEAAAPSLPDAAELAKRDARFAPVELAVDLGPLADNERRALAKMIEAARLMDTLFLRQLWSGTLTVMGELARDRSPLGQARLQSFLINQGPWSTLDREQPFVPGVPAKPAAANFYPPGATKAEVEAWMKGLLPPARAAAEGFFTTIRRASDGKFISIPYSVEYQGELGQAAVLLREAAALTREPTLKRFLEKRAAAFLSNDYYDSDLAWMELDAAIEPTLGPYEVYQDQWFNAKASFEAFIALRDDVETKKLVRFSAELQDIENHLPIDAKLRNPHIGGLAPIRVVNEVYVGGDARGGVQTAAYNLPNDERIAKEKGTKRVMLKNVQEAKFNKVLLPIAEVALSPEDRKAVAFDAFFTHILMHELMHGLGPHDVMVGGRASTVRAELQDAYSALEEAKADIAGLFALQYLVDKKAIDKAMEKTMYVTFLASAFRSIRFGTTEAHGKGQALQINYLLDAGALRVGKDGTFSVEPKKIKEAVKALVKEIMTIQGHGDRAAAVALLGKLGVVRPEVQHVLDRLSGVPVDIAPRFVTAEKLLID